MSSTLAKSTTERSRDFYENLISVDELCSITGYSKGTIYNNKDRFPHVKMGKFLRFFEKETLEVIYGKE